MKSNKNRIEKIPRSLVAIGWILVLGSVAPMLDTTMVNIIINTLQQEMHTSLAMVQWAITGFVLAMGAAVPFSGWLVARFSGKYVYLITEIAFGLTSLLAGLSWNIQSLLVFRLLQGFSAGLIMTIFFTLLVDSVGSDKIGRIMGIVMVPMAIGPMVGPIIGGIISQFVSWRWIFFINVPFTMIAAILLIVKVPYTAPKDVETKFDLTGVALLVISSAAIVYGIVQASNKGSFNNTDTLVYVGLGLLLAAIYIFYAGRHEETVLPARLFRSRNFSGSMLGIFLSGFVTTGPMIILPLFFQDIRGESIVIAALSLIPQSLGIMLSRNSVGKMIDQIGARWVVIVGLVITLIATLPFLYFDNRTAYWLIAVTMFIRGIGGAAVKSATQADAFVGISHQDSAEASMGSNLFQQIGSAFASAVLATAVASYASTHHISEPLDLLAGYHRAFLWSAIAVVILIVPAMMLTNKLKK